MISLHWRHLRVVAVVMAAIAVISCAGAPPVRDMQPVPTTQGLIFHAGKRTDQEGTPLLDLSGSRSEVGLQYGVLLRPEIRVVYGEFDKLLDKLTGGGRRRFLFVRSMRGEVQAMRAALPAGFDEELRGIAEGAGIRYSDFLFFTLTPEFLFDASCTSIVVRRGNEIAHGRNFDFVQPASFIARYPVIARVAVDGKVPYVNIGFIGLPGVYTGLNERGIAASVNTAAFSAHAAGRVIPVGFLVKSILEDCTTLREVDSVMSRSPVSHYFITVSSRDERDASVQEGLGDSVTSVPMVGGTLCIANAPISDANRHDRTSILAQGEFNLSREHALGTLTARIPEVPLPEYLLDVLGNRDFYEYHDFPAHQSLVQDSLKTINNYQTIQSVVIDWTGNRVIFSYRSSYAAFGPFLAYDLRTGRLTPYRAEDPFASQGSFPHDIEFLDTAFELYKDKGMKMDRDGWERVSNLVHDSPHVNSFLRSDWVFAEALALRHFKEAELAAREIDAAYPDYYLGPLDLGIAEFGQKHWIEAQGHFVESLDRDINSPTTRLMALAYASLASEKAGDRPESERFREEARALLRSAWVPKDLDAAVRRYVSDGELVSFLHSVADER